MKEKNVTKLTKANIQWKLSSQSNCRCRTTCNCNENTN